MAQELILDSTARDLPVVSRAENGVGLVFNRPPVSNEDQEQMWVAVSTSFAYLFSGNPKGFYLRRDDGRYEAERREPQLFDFMAHLCGYPDRGMLSVPLRPDGTCLWAAIDLDCHESGDEPIDWPALARRVSELKLPLVVCKSKGMKGAWLFCFFRDRERGVPAADARRLMLYYAQRLELGPVEVFPKQNDLDTSKGLGSGINLPYRYTLAFDADGQELEYINEFLDICWERAKFGNLLLRDLPEVPAIAPHAAVTEAKKQVMKQSTARELHQKNIATLTAMTRASDHQNDALNAAAFFAGRCFAGGAFDESEEQIKVHLSEVARATQHCSGIASTIRSGWDTGLAQPLTIVKPLKLPWRDSSKQVTVEKSPAIVGRLIYAASSTALIAKPKVGKTTFCLDACECILYGRSFLKEAVVQGNVLYISEQPLGSFVAEMINSGLLTTGQLSLAPDAPKGKFHFLTAEDWYGYSWSDIVEATVAYAIEIDAKLVVFDTLSRIARVENENDASEMQKAVDILIPFYGNGIATLISQHERKSGGDISDAGRGTGALAGSVDVLLRLTRSGGKLPDSYRNLEFIGRFPGPPEPRVIDRKTANQHSRYELQGSAPAVRSVNAQDSILEMFPDEQDYDFTLSLPEILEETELPRVTAQRALEKLVKDGLLERTGTGKRGVPFQFNRKKQPF